MKPTHKEVDRIAKINISVDFVAVYFPIFKRFLKK